VFWWVVDRIELEFILEVGVARQSFEAVVNFAAMVQVAHEDFVVLARIFHRPEVHLLVDLGHIVLDVLGDLIQEGLAEFLMVLIDFDVQFL